MAATLVDLKMSEFDSYLWGSSKHFRCYQKLGAHLVEHEGLQGVHFACWAPNALAVSVMGEFNGWNRSSHPLQLQSASTGIWSLFVPGLQVGQAYKYCVHTSQGWSERCDPYGFWSELRPSNASRVWDLGRYTWGDAEWMQQRKQRDPRTSPLSVYEVHLGSWMRRLDGSWMSYRELAEHLVNHVQQMGFTHVELLPITEHPFDGSWGYQTTGYFGPTSRFGTPDDFRFLVDRLHQAGVGVILDWVPAHFPKDGHGLAYFDGTHLYEHADPRQGTHPDWGTMIFNYGRNEVRNFLISSALFWLEQYHIDGIRVDAVASMLYLDYGRKAGEWIPNHLGGRENLEAIHFLREFNQAIADHYPDVFTVAEESTAFPKITHSISDGGLGFTFKWNMGWMHDTLEYFAKDPIHRRWHHNKLTFGMMYQYSEHYMLPFSHDEVVHLKKSMLDKMSGDVWQKRASLRALYGYKMGYPGKKLLFMGSEFGQWREWSEERALDWELLGSEGHRGLLEWTRALLHLYRSAPCMHAADHLPEGFRWLDCDDAEHSWLVWQRECAHSEEVLVFVSNFTPVVRHTRLQLPYAGNWEVVLNSDDAVFGGSGVRPLAGPVAAEAVPHRGQPFSLEMTLPPLTTVVLRGARPAPPKATPPRLRAQKSEPSTVKGKAFKKPAQSPSEGLSGSSS